ncbi:MAG: serine hydrolase [Bacteroidota bacterium]
MKKWFWIYFLLPSFFAGAQNTLDVDALDKYFEKARKDWQTPGMAVGIMYNDTILLAKGYGTLSADSDVPVDIYTKFGIASNTKAFTAAALAILVDQKKIQWNEKVIKYVPYFKLYDDYVTKEITIRDILSHRTGLKTFSGDLIWYNSDYKPKEIIEHARFLKPSHGFREKYGYSNIMYLVAGQIIEEVSGTSYEDFITEKIFKPIGMGYSNVSITKQKDDENVAQPHAKVKGKMVPISIVNWDNMAPAGGINSNIHDMMLWISLHLNRGQWGDKTIFSKEQSRKMWMPTTIDDLSGFSEQLHPTKHFACYGMGWEMFDYYGYKIICHSGGLDGMVSQVFLIPELNIGGVFLTNTATSLPYALMHQTIETILGDPKTNDWSDIYMRLAGSYESFIEESEKEAERTRKKELTTTHELKEYAGLYSGNVYGNAKVELKSGELHLRLVHTPTLHATLEHWEKDVFRVEFKEHPSLPKGRVYFILDKETSKVKQMVIDVPNPDFDFTELDFNKVK